MENKQMNVVFFLNAVSGFRFGTDFIARHLDDLNFSDIIEQLEQKIIDDKELVKKYKGMFLKETGMYPKTSNIKKYCKQNGIEILPSHSLVTTWENLLTKMGLKI